MSKNHDNNIDTQIEPNIAPTDSQEESTAATDEALPDDESTLEENNGEASEQTENEKQDNDVDAQKEALLERDRKKFNLGMFLSYTITIVVILLIALWIALAKGVLTAESTKNVYGILADAFTVPGIVATCLGVLIVIAGTGFFTSLKYIGMSILSVFIPAWRLRQKRYKDFKEEEDKKRKKLKTDFMLICGISAVAIAIIFIVLWNIS